MRSIGGTLGCRGLGLGGADVEIPLLAVACSNARPHTAADSGRRVV